MKKMKKLLSMLLAVVMVLAMAAPSFAEGEGTGETSNPGKITIDNPAKDVTYTAYKIFDLTYLTKQENDKDVNYGYIYTINSTTNPWYSTVNTHKEELNIILTEQVVNGSGNGIYEVSMKKKEGSTTDEPEKLDAAKFASILKDANVTDPSGKALALKTIGEGDAQKTIAIAENLELGYYFVANTNGGLCNLNTTDPDVTIHDKNKIVFDKEDDAVSVDLGQVVNYTINTEVPDTTGFTSFYDFIITDEMSSGLTFNKDVTVTIDGTAWTPTVNEQLIYNNKGFTLTIPVLDRAFGTPIVIKYSATVNENAIAEIEENKAKLEYSSNPEKREDKGTKTDEEDVYSTAIIINKHVAGHEDQPLAGAQFVLRKTETITNEDGITTTKVTYYHDDSDSDTEKKATKVDWKENQVDATIKTTDDKGKADFSGLKRDTTIKYELIEVKAPDGYNLLDAPVEVEMLILDSNNKNIDNPLERLEAQTETDKYKNPIETPKNLTFEKKIANNQGTRLPSTGGIGTTIFYAAGIILMAGAVFFVVRRKRA